MHGIGSTEPKFSLTTITFRMHLKAYLFGVAVACNWDRFINDRVTV